MAAIFNFFKVAVDSKLPVDNHFLIWTDGNIDTKDDESQHTLSKLREVVTNVTSCTEPEQCMKVLNSIGDKKAFVICSGSFGRGLVPNIHGMPNVAVIYIFCGNKEQHKEWAKKWPKVQGVFTEIQPICESLKKVRYGCDCEIKMLGLRMWM